MDLFYEDMPFYKGNLHCHSTRSDGSLTPNEVKKVYLDLGYDFLAITDHRILGEPTHMEGTMLMLAGVEMDFILPGEALHLIGIGAIDKLHPPDLAQSPQTCIDLIRQSGGRAILAHPAWSLNTLETLSMLKHVTAAEIYNSVSSAPWNGNRADSSVLLDIAATHGSLYQFVASDDSHSYNGEAGRSSTVVQAEELSESAILRALDEGRFYCTQGPRFEQISFDGGTLSIRCSPAQTIIFYSNLVWSDGRCVTGENLTAASYSVPQGSGEHFLRVEIIDAQGNSAWSNPLAL